MVILCTVASCAACHVKGETAGVTAQLGLRGWCCTLCGGKAKAEISWGDILHDSFWCWWDVVSFEWRLGRLSKHWLFRVLNG